MYEYMVGIVLCDRTSENKFYNKIFVVLLKYSLLVCDMYNRILLYHEFHNRQYFTKSHLPLHFIQSGL